MTKYIKYFLFLTLFVSASVVSAQPGDPDGGDPDVPITGIEILLAAGGLFGAKRIFDKARSK